MRVLAGEEAVIITPIADCEAIEQANLYTVRFGLETAFVEANGPAILEQIERGRGMLE